MLYKRGNSRVFVQSKMNKLLETLNDVKSEKRVKFADLPDGTFKLRQITSFPCTNEAGISWQALHVQLESELERGISYNVYLPSAYAKILTEVDVQELSSHRVYIRKTGRALSWSV